MPVFHRHDAHGPVCGAAQGCNAADFDPPEITCKRCIKAPVPLFGRQIGWRKDADGWCLLLLPEGVWPEWSISPGVGRPMAPGGAA